MVSESSSLAWQDIECSNSIVVASRDGERPAFQTYAEGFEVPECREGCCGPGTNQTGTSRVDSGWKKSRTASGNFNFRLNPEVSMQAAEAEVVTDSIVMAYLVNGTDTGAGQL